MSDAKVTEWADELPVEAEPGGRGLKIDLDSYEALIDEIRRRPPGERATVVDELIESLPEPSEFEFILILTSLIEHTFDDYHLREGVLNRCRRILEAPPENIDRDPLFARFAAFHALTIYSYQSQTISEWGERHETYGHLFLGWEHESMYLFDRSMQEYFTNESRNISSARSLLQTLANGELARNPGVINAYVECTLLACDKKNLLVADESLLDAAELITKAIELYPYSEYYRNWGRLLGIYGERTGNVDLIDEGIEKIEEGMDKEEAANTQKLSVYRQHLTNLNSRKRSVEAELKIDTIRNEIESIDERAEQVAQQVRSETLQFLGFFAAIITFIITGVQFSTELTSVSQIATIIPIMTGCLVFSFSVFVFMFDEDPLDDGTVLLVVWAIGTFLVSLGVAFSFAL